MLSTRILILLFTGLLSLASGCSSRKPVEVLVTLDGTPVEGAGVSLIADGMSGTISGITGADGRAKLDSHTKSGVPAGTYKVLVTKSAGPKSGSGPVDMTSPDYAKMMKGAGKGPSKSELPEIYNDIKATPLTLTVPPSTSPAPIELKKK